MPNIYHYNSEIFGSNIKRGSKERAKSGGLPQGRIGSFVKKIKNADQK